MKISKDSNGGVHVDEEAQSHWASIYADIQKRTDKAIAVLKSHGQFRPEYSILGIEALESLALKAEEGSKNVMKGVNYGIQL